MSTASIVKDKAKSDIDELSKLIHFHAYKYYVLDDPEIPGLAITDLGIVTKIEVSK